MPNEKDGPSEALKGFTARLRGDFLFAKYPLSFDDIQDIISERLVKDLQTYEDIIQNTHG